MISRELKLDASGLLTVVAQDRRTGDIRMLAHANEEALRRTAESGRAWFYSRSRAALWQKGEESGNVLTVHEMWLDCDADAVLYLVTPTGPSCHTGKPTCFFRPLHGGIEGEGRFASPVLSSLERELQARRTADGERSYTRTLLDAGPIEIGAKIREEADELARAIADESDERVVAEAADLIYHAMVGLLARGLALADVEAELARRFGVSGHDEKASRS
jgi:phosphoribosyl-ATP pyrophosphohydrolase/phosphoribosyl-AMP cyclohydrolase